MLCVAAITVNKTIFGHRFMVSENPEQQITDTDTISVASDGTLVIHTDGIPGTITGYAGPVPLDILIKDGKIEQVAALPNDETPSFFERVSPLLTAWNGMSPEEALSSKVDAVSGATYSSEAVINNLTVGLNYYEGSDKKPDTSFPWKIWVAMAVTLAACIVPLLVRNKWYHNLQLIANVIVLGFWCGQFLDYSLMLRYISTGFVWPAGVVAIVMLIAAFIYPLFGRQQHYCNHICPLGSAQILMAEICKYKIRISPKILRGFDWFRKILWAVLMLLLWVDCFTQWMDYELFSAFQFQSASWWVIGTAILFVALSAVVSRPYCRFVCPTGSLFKRAENIG